MNTCTCITYEDIIDRLDPCTSSNFCVSREKVEYNICLAISIIEGILGASICPYEECKRLKSCGDNILYYTPTTSDKLIEFTSMTLSQSGCDNTELSPEDFLNLGNRLKTNCNRSIPRGDIIICGLWASFEVLPQTLKEAVTLLALEKSQSGITGIDATQRNYKKVDWDDFKLEFFPDTNTDPGTSTGYPQIDQLLFSVPTSNQIKMSILDRCRKTNICCKKGEIRDVR